MLPYGNTVALEMAQPTPLDPLVKVKRRCYLSETEGLGLMKYEVCSNSIRIGIVVVVHWVGCVCNQS